MALSGVISASDPAGMQFRLPALTAVVVALVLPGAAQAADTCDGAQLIPDAGNATVVRHATLCLVNAERTDRGLGRLKPVASLEGVADDYAARMVRERFFDHSSPDGGTFLARIKRTSYLRGELRRWSVGENIAWGAGTRATPAQIVAAWMQSPGHRRNILDARYTELGLGVAVGSPRGGADHAAATYVNEFGARHR